jgi:hypothetical protein
MEKENQTNEDSGWTMEKEKAKAETYYKLEEKERNLAHFIKATREEPVLSLSDVARVIRKNLAPEETKVLRDFLGN